MRITLLAVIFCLVGITSCQHKYRFRQKVKTAITPPCTVKKGPAKSIELVRLQKETTYSMFKRNECPTETNQVELTPLKTTVTAKQPKQDNCRIKLEKAPPREKVYDDSDIKKLGKKSLIFSIASLVALGFTAVLSLAGIGVTFFIVSFLASILAIIFGIRALKLNDKMIAKPIAGISIGFLVWFIDFVILLVLIIKVK